MLLSKAKPPKTDEPKKKRRKINLCARVVTSDDFLKGIEENEREFEEKKKPKKKQYSTKNPSKECSDNNDVFPVDESEEGNQDTDKYHSEGSDIEIGEALEPEDSITSLTVETLKEANKKEVLQFMRDIVATLDDDKKGLFYAVHYGDRYYWGKLQHVFALEPEDDATQAEFSFRLSYKLCGWWEFPRKLYTIC